MKRYTHYAVLRGFRTGVFTVDEVSEVISNYPNAKYKGFYDESAARRFYYKMTNKSAHKKLVKKKKEPLKFTIISYSAMPKSDGRVFPFQIVKTKPEIYIYGNTILLNGTPVGCWCYLLKDTDEKWHKEDGIIYTHSRTTVLLYAMMRALTICKELKYDEIEVKSWDASCIYPFERNWVKEWESSNAEYNNIQNMTSQLWQLNNKLLKMIKPKFKRLNIANNPELKELMFSIYVESMCRFADTYNISNYIKPIYDQRESAIKTIKLYF